MRRVLLCCLTLIVCSANFCDQGVQPPASCESTPNAVPTDLNLDGVSEGCSVFDRGSYTLRLIDGDATVTLGACGLPVQIVAPGQTATLVWSPAADSVQVTVQAEGATETFSYPVDLSDDALYAALADFGASIGEDNSLLAAWLDAHPGVVSESARCLNGKPRTAPDASAAKPLINQQDRGPFTDINDYLAFLATQAIQAEGDAIDLEAELGRQGNPTRLQSLHLSLLQSIARTMKRVFDDQEQACIPCTSRCGLGCIGACSTDAGGLTTCHTERARNCLPPNRFVQDIGCLSGDRGACCIYRFGEFLQCRAEMGSDACRDVGGVFRPGQFCSETNCQNVGGACCVDGHDCTEVNDRFTCERRSIEVGGRFFQFSPEQTCAGVRAEGGCNDGVCCFSDGSYNCDILTEQDCATNPGQAGVWVPGPCEAATCGG